MNLADHLVHIREVLLVLRRDQLFATIKKCEFGDAQVHFLGYIVSAESLSVDPAKIEAIIRGQYLQLCQKLEVSWPCFFLPALCTTI